MRIELHQIHKAFGPQAVLRGIDLTIESGRVTVIIGASGTGKSVLLKIMAGLLRPDRGTVQLDGKSITELHERELLPLRRRVGYIFQNGALLASLNVVENVALGLIENELAPREEAGRLAREQLGEVGLEGAADKYPAELSGGMRKRAAIARALVMNPAALLYDEPTAGLDPPRARQIEERIAEVNQRTGATSVVVTHDMETVDRLASYVYMLHEGQVLYAGEPAGLREHRDPRVREFIDP